MQKHTMVCSNSLVYETKIMGVKNSFEVTLCSELAYQIKYGNTSKKPSTAPWELLNDQLRFLAAVRDSQL